MGDNLTGVVETDTSSVVGQEVASGDSAELGCIQDTLQTLVEDLDVRNMDVLGFASSLDEMMMGIVAAILVPVDNCLVVDLVTPRLRLEERNWVVIHIVRAAAAAEGDMTDVVGTMGDG